MGTSVLAGYDHKTLYRFSVANPSWSHSMRFSSPSSNFTRRYINLPLAGRLWTDSQCPCLTKDKQEYDPFWRTIKSNLRSNEVRFSVTALPTPSVTFSERQTCCFVCPTDGTESDGDGFTAGEVVDGATDAFPPAGALFVPALSDLHC